MANTITFKNSDRSGRFASFQRREAAIKLNGKKVGWISERQIGEVEVWLHIRKEPTLNEPSPFRNARLKIRYKTIQEAKAGVKEAFPKLSASLDIYQHDDEIV